MNSLGLFVAASTKIYWKMIIIEGDSPIFAGLICPKIIGGTETTSSLILQSTSGVGTTGAQIKFLVGNNGGTEAARILNNGHFGIGETFPLSKLHVETVDSGLIRWQRTGISNEWGIEANLDGFGIWNYTRDGYDVWIKNNGNFGFGTLGADRVVEINSATGINLRLTYNDSDGSAANYVDYLVTSGGNGIITPSGGVLSITGNCEPATDNTYYLGRNSITTPKAWKGIIVKDTTNGKYYRGEAINGVWTMTEIT